MCTTIENLVWSSFSLFLYVVLFVKISSIHILYSSGKNQSRQRVEMNHDWFDKRDRILYFVTSKTFMLKSYELSALKRKQNMKKSSSSQLYLFVYVDILGVWLLSNEHKFCCCWFFDLCKLKFLSIGYLFNFSMGFSCDMIVCWCCFVVAAPLCPLVVILKLENDIHSKQYFSADNRSSDIASGMNLTYIMIRFLRLRYV